MTNKVPYVPSGPPPAADTPTTQEAGSMAAEGGAVMNGTRLARIVATLALIAAAVAALSVPLLPREWIVPAALMVLLGLPAVALLAVIGKYGPEVRRDRDNPSGGAR